MPARVETIGPVYRGSDVTLNFTEDNVTGTSAPPDITTWTISWRLKVNQTDASTVLGPISATITSGPAGSFAVAITAAQTLTLPVGQYAWDVWRTDSGSANPLALGPMTVLGTVKIP